jgi:hypothetical protein
MLKRAGIAVAVLFAVGSSAAQADEADEKAAVAAAEAWLAVVDKGEAAKSWDEAASIFKSSVSKEKWAQAIAAARAPLGKFTARTLTKKVFATKLPGAPDGKYVVIIYEATYANKKAVEQVTPTLDKDGKWRVSGYFVK